MNPKWRALAADFLERASEEFSNHGCNDWEWPDDWTAEDIKDFGVAFETWNEGKPPEVGTPLWQPHDYAAMHFLADLIRSDSEGKEG